MLNKNLDIDQLKKAYSLNNRVTISNAFDPVVAQNALSSLETEIPWQLSYRENGIPSLFTAEQLANLNAAQLADIYQKIAQLGASNFQYCYYHYSVTGKNFQYCSQDAYIHQLKDFLSSSVFFDFVKAVTGAEGLENFEMLLGRYTANNFLMMHNDSEKPERRITFVLNLTRDWHVDWGGLLHFIDEQGQVTETFVPTFNSLTLFSVPALHKVSMAMPFVNRSRYTVTGWLNI